MTPEEEDDLLDRLPAHLRGKVLEWIDPEEAPETPEPVPLTSHFGLKLLRAFCLGILGLVAGLMLMIGSAFLLTPISILIWLLSVIPLARLFINAAEAARSKSIE